MRRLGGTRNEPIDVWIIAATNEDLDGRHPGAPIPRGPLPPPRRAHAHAAAAARARRRRPQAGRALPRPRVHRLRRCRRKTLAPDAQAALTRLRVARQRPRAGQVMERVALLSDSETLTAEALGLDPGRAVEGRGDGGDRGRHRAGMEPAHSTTVSRRRCSGRSGRPAGTSRATAALLGISRNTLRARIEKYGLRAGEAHAGAAAAARRRRPGRERATPSSFRRSRPASPMSFSRAPPRWERRRVTMLRASPSLPGARSLARPRALELLLDKVRSFGGASRGWGPTGIAAAFGLDPTEDAPSRAAHAAMAISTRRGAGERPGARSKRGAVAIHSAESMVGRVGDAAELDLEGKQSADRGSARSSGAAATPA